MREPFLEPFLRKMRIRRVIDEVKNVPMCNILDIGCGYNYMFLSSIEPYIAHGTGVDFKVKEASYGKISIINLTLNETLPFSECSFDVVTMLAVLEHIEKPKQIITEVCRVLKPEGKLILTVPGKRAKPFLEFLAFKIGIVNKKEIEDHKIYYDLEEINQLVTDIDNLEIVKHEHFQFRMNNFCVLKKIQR